MPEQPTAWMESDNESEMHYLCQDMSYVNSSAIFGEFLIISQSCKETNLV